RLLPPLAVDDVVALLDAGAYGSVMGSNYNRHMLPEEVLVDNGIATIIRRRQRLDDVLALES
ncbi:MAG: diaminopimelate decarboxylase, partial [Vicinamibacterales bacterium]